MRDFCLACVFAELTGCQEVWKIVLEGFNVRQSAVVNEWKAEAKIEGIQGLLTARLGGVPAAGLHRACRRGRCFA